jgi:hypothetical protein
MMDGGFDRHGVPAWIRHLTEAFHKPTHRTMIVSPVRKAGVLSRVGANPSGKSANWCTVTEIPNMRMPAHAPPGCRDHRQHRLEVPKKVLYAPYLGYETQYLMAQI